MSRPTRPHKLGFPVKAKWLGQLLCRLRAMLIFVVRRSSRRTLLLFSFVESIWFELVHNSVSARRDVSSSTSPVRHFVK